MIGYLSGSALKTPTGLLICIGGVGYEVSVTASAFQSIVEGETIAVFVYEHLKEDKHDLFGFLTSHEKTLFLKFLDVDGIGPKTALAILDRGTDAILRAIRDADVSFFSSVPRVGKKSAQKIIIELQKIAGSETSLDLLEPTGIIAEAIEALTSLGFSESESRRVLKTLAPEENTLERLVTLSIQALTKGAR
jgi:holliday junction DNA helicase RuvA